MLGIGKKERSLRIIYIFFLKNKIFNTSLFFVKKITALIVILALKKKTQ